MTPLRRPARPRPPTAAGPDPDHLPRPLPRRGHDLDDDLALERDLGDLVDDERRRRAVSERRDRLVREIVEREVATLDGILRDVAEQDADVLVEHDGGRVAGRLVGLGGDCVVVATRDGRRSVVALAHLVDVGVAPPAPDPRGRRRQVAELGLRQVLAEAAEERRGVRLHVGASAVVDGTLVAVGEDVVTLVGHRAGALRLVALGRIARIDLDP